MIRFYLLLSSLFRDRYIFYYSNIFYLEHFKSILEMHLVTFLFRIFLIIYSFSPLSTATSQSQSNTYIACVWIYLFILLCFWFYAGICISYRKSLCPIQCCKMSKNVKKKKRLSANICQDNTLERHRHEHCLLALDNVCPQITFPSIFLHSVSGTTIINFWKFPDDQGCSVCQGTQYCVVHDVWLLQPIYCGLNLQMKRN